MSGLFGTLDIAARGLLVTQNGIRVTSHNTANVETPGYTRQRQLLTAAPAIPHPAGAIGTGVEQQGIQRVSDELLHRQFVSADARAAAFGVEANALDVVQELFNEQSGPGLGARISALYDAFEDVASATTPGAPVERGSLRTAAQSLIDAFRGVDAELRRALKDADRSAVALLDSINGLARDIAALNRAIVREEAVAPANDLRDRRDALVRELAKKVEISSFEQSDGSVVVMVARGLALVEGTTARSLVAQTDLANPFDPTVSRILFDLGPTQADVSDDLGGGELGGHLQVRDQLVPDAIRELDVLAYNLAAQVNAVHQLGVGRDGSTGDFFAAPAQVEDAARDLALAPAILASPDAIAAGLTSDPGDNRNALALAALRTTATPFYLPGDPPGPPTGAARTALDHHGFLVGDLGERARVAAGAHDVQARVLGELEARRESMSGVSLDEEMIKLIRLESAYQANGRVIATIQTLLDALVQLV
ncbi:MAG: flagellar hook-associated protein FlgK [Proteobacteria bacterium]|nr:MAG: flagellar hook-associated protein FlgK [Pseudomonadota bacterium]